jgi:hypothetical protein
MSDLHRRGAFRGDLPVPKGTPNPVTDAFAILCGPEIQTPADNENRIIRVKIWFKEALTAETILVEVAKQTA